VAATFAFDVYGTLIDPIGISRQLQSIVGDATQAFAHLWRSKQVEYLFRRGLGRDYQPFSVCTRQALDFTAMQLQVDMSAADKEQLMDAYRELPAFAEAPTALQRLKEAGYHNYAFSNGERDELQLLLAHAGLERVLDGIVSVHAVRSFKPDPAVYAHFLKTTGATADTTWLVSGNPFDVIGALAAGWKTAWVSRDPDSVFDPWGVAPTVVVSSLDELLAEVIRVP